MTVLNPTLLAEVLSPASEARDRGAKWQSYQQIVSLRHYLLIVQDYVRVECYTRQPDGRSWMLRIATELSDHVELSHLGGALSVAELYHKVGWSAPASLAELTLSALRQRPVSPPAQTRPG